MARKNARARKQSKPRRLNPRISEAQKSAFERREERRKAQEKKIAAEKAEQERREKAGLPTRGALGPTKLEPKRPDVIQMQRGLDQDKIRKRDEGLSRQRLEEQAARDVRVRGLAVPGSESITDPIVNPSAYSRSAQQEFDAGALGRGHTGQPITLAQIQQQATALKRTGRAVYMGKSKGTLGGRADPTPYSFEGPRPFAKPQDQPIEYDQFTPIESLVAWLADPVRVDQIKRRANAAGLNVESYDDITKVWTSVIKMAASTYATTGRKVTPWDLLDLRGRHVDPETGKPKKRTGRSVTIEEIDSATARLMVEDAVKKMTGQRPTEDQIDAFVAKAQAIARQTPLIETFEQEVGFDDQVVEDSTTITSRTGGQQVATDRAEVAMLEQIRNSPEYSNRQAAGTYGPLLFEALGSPID